jgi:SAM-dependent methyltransferase
MVQQAAPPGGRLLATAKRAAEHLLWARVGGQVMLEPRLRFSRPIPTSVPPTAVLRTRAEWEDAVRECRRLRLPLHHDRQKNWDALGAVGAVLSAAGKDARVVDAGSARYSSVLPWLRLYGLTNLVGTNLEFGDEVRRGKVRFRYGDVTATDFGDGELDAVTCMSVIEHGVPVKSFLHETARILRPGGVLCLSTDYDQQPPDTTGITAYGVQVKIFGPDDIRELVQQAEEVGLRLQGELQLDHPERPVHWPRTGLDYTFILLTFVRD